MAGGINLDTLGNTLINANGKDIIWRETTEELDPDYGNPTMVEKDDTIVRAVIEDISESHSYKYPGKVPEFDATIYAKKQHDFDIDDKLIRNYEEDDEIVYTIKEVINYESYKELNVTEVG